MCTFIFFIHGFLASIILLSYLLRTKVNKNSSAETGGGKRETQREQPYSLSLLKGEGHCPATNPTVHLQNNLTYNETPVNVPDTNGLLDII